MSKKSRRRNKRLLALAGLAGAVELSSKRKRDASIADNEAQESGFAASTKKPNIGDVSGSKKDTAVKTPTTIQDNKDTSRKKSMAETSTVPAKRPGITVYDDGSIKAKDKGSGNFVDYANKEKYSNRLNTKPPGASGSTTSTGTTARGSSTFNDKIRANNAALKNGGRAGYKSGGKVKGCGIAKRGLGRAMKKGKR